MTSEGANPRTNTTNNNKKKRRPQYLPYNKSTKKGYSTVRPGIQGFFITCDGGRESQARNEAINLLDKFYEELLQEKSLDRDVKSSDQASSFEPSKTVLKISDGGSSSGGNESDKNSGDENDYDGEREGKEEGTGEGQSSMKKRRVEAGEDNIAAKIDKVPQARGSTIDKILEAELEELGDREKVRFAGLDSGCNGIIFIRMRKELGCPSPPELVEYIMKTAASTRKHMSRFILRLLPVELTCYASTEEITRAAKPLIELHFPSGEGHAALKFGVLYECRANSGIDRLKIIDTVAKLVPQPHKVDLSNPDKTIIVQIVKTICMIGVVQKFKELSKYNLRQLTGFKQS
eukprot:Gb_03238 [translate_table: standard]